MNRAGYFNDAPILTPDDDRFGIDRFAQALAKSFKDIDSPIGATIAINGPWGSGKSSAVNLIRYHLRDDFDSEKLELIDFRCWWFRGEEALTLGFLQTLNASLQKSLTDKTRELIPRLGKTLLQAGPVVGPAINIATGGIWGALTSGSMDFAKRFFSEGESVEGLFQKLSKALDEQDKRFLVLIDDIDRLTPNEALLVFRLVKSVGRLPNVMYLLVFDRQLAEKAVTQVYPSEGPHFLEKIIQASFELPLPARDDLNTAALSQIEAFCGPPSDKNQLLRFMNLFYDAISPHLNTPRDLTRLYNAMTVSWPAVAKEVDVGDYVALEIMRLFEPLLYNAIRTNKAKVCGVRSGYERKEDPKQAIEDFLQFVPEKRRENARLALMRLFPRFENVGYSNSFIETWEAQRRACTDKHFDTYFRMGTGDETISIAEVDEFIENAGSPEYVKKTFRNALDSIRKNDKSKVPLLFDEINVHASRIEKSKFQPLISAIFEIADDIHRDEDRERGGYSFGDNHLRIHWLIRKLTFDRCDLDERSTIFLAACKNAQVGWLTDFTSSAIADHFPREGREPEPIEKCLVMKDHLTELKALCVKSINSAASTGELLFHSQLPFILFRWKEFSEDDGYEVRAWTSNQLKIDKSVYAFARAFTGESWSQGLGMVGLGDRVAMRNIRASVSGLEHIIDVSEFRKRLEELEGSEALEEQARDAVSLFLGAWRKQEKEEDR
ncbi:MAG TPA: P-loop NTPase fold protein [Alphaproteobacteria bacterium]|nr:P-loop NTPase fold protein [Alphaproteobacteria bacterium]